MSRRLNTALLLLPVLAMAGEAGAGDYCARLTARLNQMPQLIGSSTASHYRAESIFRLNRLEIAIRRDMRRLDCPTNSIIEMNGHQHACSGLGEELASVIARKREYQDLQPVLSQTVDDGSGLAPAIIKEMKRAGCDLRGTQQDVEIIGTGASAGDEGAIAASQVAWAPEDAAGSEHSTQDLASVLGDDAESDYGTPDPYGMIEIRPADKKDIEDGKLASVTLPKLEGQDLLKGPGSIDELRTKSQNPPAEKQAVEAIPERDYDPNDPAVRKIGPTFLADQDGIDLRKPGGETSLQ